MSDDKKVINLFEKKKELENKEEKQPVMKPQFDKDEYFKVIIEQNKRKKEKEKQDKLNHNRKVKRDYRLEDKDK